MVGRQEPSVDQSGIIDAGLAALRHTCILIDLVLKHEPVLQDNQTGFMIVSHREVADSLEALCYQQSVAFGCLFDLGERHQEKHGRLRKERVTAFRALLNGIDLTNLTNKGPRNAFAHFDEYYLKQSIGWEGPWLINLAASHREAFGLPAGAENRMVRVYFYDIDKMYIFGRSLQLKVLRSEITHVLDRLKAW